MVRGSWLSQPARGREYPIWAPRAQRSGAASKRLGTSPMPTAKAAPRSSGPSRKTKRDWTSSSR